MTDNANPSQDPADDDTLGGVFRMVLRKFLQSVDGCLPATVIAVDAERNYATVKPLVMVQSTDDSLTARAQIAQVPIFTMGAGNYVMSFPVTPGDLGWIVASDRDISLYLQGNKEAGPNTNRLHSFEDGLFFPDKARQWALAEEDAENAVLQSLDGSVKITLGAAKIKIVHPTRVDIVAPNTFVSQNLRVGGTIVCEGDVVWNNGGTPVHAATHRHSGVTTGGGTSGGPVP